MSVRVFIVDDQPTFRDGLRVALDAATSVEVVGEAASEEEAVGALSVLPPIADVVLIAIGPGASADVAAVRLIAEEASAMVLVMSSAEDDDIIVGALRAGARGFIDKGISREDLLHSVHLAANGGAAFSAQTAARLCTYFSAIHSLPRRLAFPELTDRETQILELLAQGRDNRGIARALSLAEKTVRNNITSVFAKLRVTDRTAAALRAREAGLGLDGIGRRSQELARG